MTVVPVAVGSGYDVIVERGSLTRADALLARYVRGGRLVVVVDANVVEPHAIALTSRLQNSGVRVELIVIPSGEGSKSWPRLIALTERLLALEVERGEAIVALGGGVVGDLAGFASAIVKRGTKIVQCPTTLLAQVDSSVGGKTAINASAGKNLIGVFHQPSLVIVDPEVLSTLPPREFRAGYAEIVKYGLIDDSAFFKWLEAHGTRLTEDHDALAEAITRSIAAKARIVAADERETTGTRALLNLGHTFAHALEAETGFGPRLLHGEAVAVGMALAFRLSVRLGLCPPADADRVDRHLRAAGLPASLQEAGISAAGATLAGHMAHDKKRANGVVPLLLARGIGRTFLTDGVDLATVAGFLDAEQRVLA